MHVGGCWNAGGPQQGRRPIHRTAGADRGRGGLTALPTGHRTGRPRLGPARPATRRSLWFVA
nr:hypothetical protein [Streptomyces filipinensis]